MRTQDFSSLVKNCNTSRAKMKTDIILQISCRLNDTPYSYIVWIYKHTIWKSASDTLYKKLIGAKSGFESIQLRYRNPSRRCWLLPGTWSHLWFAGVRECPPWCSIVGATVTVNQFFWILHFCHTCVTLCRVELVVQFPARGSTQVLLCILHGVL